VVSVSELLNLLAELPGFPLEEARHARYRRREDGREERRRKEGRAHLRLKAQRRPQRGTVRVSLYLIGADLR